MLTISNDYQIVILKKKFHPTLKSRQSISSSTTSKSSAGCMAGWAGWETAADAALGGGKLPAAALVDAGAALN